MNHIMLWQSILLKCTHDDLEGGATILQDYSSMEGKTQEIIVHQQISTFGKVLQERYFQAIIGWLSEIQENATFLRLSALNH